LKKQEQPPELKNVLIVTSVSDKKLDVKIGTIEINSNGTINKIETIKNIENINEEKIKIEHIAMPGFIDAHNHSRQIALQAFPKSGWKNNSSKPKDNQVKKIFKWFLLDTLKSGVTFFCDWPEHPLNDPNMIIECIDEMKLRGCIRVVLQHDKGKPLEKIGEIYKKLSNSINKCKFTNIDKPDVQLALWIPEENKLEFSRKVFSFLARFKSLIKESIFFQMHLAENKERKEACPNAIELIFEFIFNNFIPLEKHRAIFIHAIWIDKDDLDVMKKFKNNLGIVTCPRFSDGKLAPIKDLLSAGLPIGLGSDTSSPDPFYLIRKMISLHKSQVKSKQISIEEAFYMATLGGAKIFGMEHKIGSIDKDKDADIVLVKNPAAINIKLFSKEGNEKERVKAIKRLFTRNVLRKEHVDIVFIKGKKVLNNGELYNPIPSFNFYNLGYICFQMYDQIFKRLKDKLLKNKCCRNITYPKSIEDDIIDEGKKAANEIMNEYIISI
jgi:cytosine/adenosine deaminase-related metal-dependent hydrolase